VDLILITHGHGDHMGNVVELARRTGAPVYAIYEVALYLQACGLSNVVGMNISGSATLDGITFTMVEACHSSMVEEGGHTGPGGTPAGFVIRLENGYTLYHAGDTGVFSDMKLIAELYRPSLVMLPIGGLFTMGPREAAKACTLLNPKIILGMHYGTFPVLTGTPAQLKKLLPPRLKPRVRELEPGKPLVV
jgi:L-ascorbate metabolism protein UlaG (beta-lactamase superfamily)